ncbi:sulfite exporter TauE/SafE family protein [Citricoccus sp. SGAir0253]|uniref:sulfite exporter TauE/SafE family protein n=1 Tax=Citricoccus sp. SGAir0253 TaxID=2567881 RepID=UPI0010CD309C|nr:sulfite exporter TauE/SafE family protein [Citricoccus sp. SGAir0253]QCU78092.1 sulfite exporter TauE/SafE family protein [Citricoccus sp. SGAir0253]
MEILGLEPWQVVVILLAGFWAGTINTVVGSGTLVTFPVLVAMGFPPVTAQISNAMGLVAAGVSGVFGYRRELAESRAVLPALTLASLSGGLLGAFLLLVLPEEVFGVAAPILIVVALCFVVFQPRMSAWVRRRKARRQEAEGTPTPALAAAEPEVPSRPVSPALWLLVFGAGVYGGYFVAAQGVLLMGILGVFMAGTLVHANAVKTYLSLAVNLIAAVSYLLFALDRIDWRAVLLIAVSSMLGASLGARIGRRIRPVWLRAVIVAVGLAGLVNMVWRLVAGG